jgi:hypothetical protein
VTEVPDFSSEHHELCKGCALGKYTKTAFPSSDSRAAGILDLIHSYVCGPMSSASLTGSLTMLYSLMTSLGSPRFSS